MSERILVPMDDSEMATQALEHAFETHPEADVTVLHCVGLPSLMMGEAVGLSLEDDLDAAARERAEPVLERARAIADDHDRTIDTDVGLGEPSRAIVERGDRFDAIVMGSHGKHSGDVARRYLVGNVAENVFRRAPVPVTFVR